MGKLRLSLTPVALARCEKEVVPTLFTQRQFDILMKRLKDEELTTNERVDLYRSINKKIKAMFMLMNIDAEMLWIQGKEHMIKERIEPTKKILKKIAKNHKNQKILIAGSYLWKKEFKDIDIFIISDYDKEDYRDDQIHINYLHPDTEKTLFYQSLAKISMTNFVVAQEVKDKPTLDNIIMLYQEIVTHLLQKENIRHELRTFILETKYLEGGIVLNGKELDVLCQSILKHKKIVFHINRLLIQTLSLVYDHRILKKELQPLIENNKKLMQKYKKTENLIAINNTLAEVLAIES